MRHDPKLDGIWDPETERYYYPDPMYPEFASDDQVVWEEQPPVMLKPELQAKWDAYIAEQYGEKLKEREGEKARDSIAEFAGTWEQYKAAEPLPQSALDLAAECDRIKAMLVEKNLSYSNSALEPTRIFSKANSREQLLVRIDDKLSRIKGGGSDLGEDTILDLVGYLILLRVAMRGDNA